MSDTSYTVEVDVNGRILIPAKLRRANNWSKGSKLTLSKQKDGLKIVSKKQQLLSVQEKFLKNFPKSGSVENFLEFKKEQSDRESLSINNL